MANLNNENPNKPLFKEGDIIRYKDLLNPFLLTHIYENGEMYAVDLWNSDFRVYLGSDQSQFLLLSVENYHSSFEKWKRCRRNSPGSEI